MTSNRVDRMLLLGFLVPAIVLLVVFYIFPALWAVRISFTDLALTGAKALNYTFVGFKEYERLFSNPDFYGALGRTIIYTVGTCVGQFAIGLAAALLLSRKRLVGQAVLMSAIILPLVVPSLIQALLWQNMLASGEFGTLNRIIGVVGIAPVEWVRDWPMVSVILVNFWNNSGFAMILFLAGLENIPGDTAIYQAAAHSLRDPALVIAKYAGLPEYVRPGLRVDARWAWHADDDHGHLYVQPEFSVFRAWVWQRDRRRFAGDQLHHCHILRPTDACRSLRSHTEGRPK
jgi:ABC-type Fe3+ transport system permease subunit